MFPLIKLVDRFHSHGPSLFFFISRIICSTFQNINIILFSLYSVIGICTDYFMVEVAGGREFIAKTQEQIQTIQGCYGSSVKIEE